MFMLFTQHSVQEIPRGRVERCGPLSGKKVEQAILRGLRLLPADVGAQLKSMLSPQSLVVVVASLVGLAVAQAFGIGELVDALVLLAGIGFYGWGAVDGCRDLLHSIRTALNARTDHQYACKVWHAAGLA